MIYTIGYQKLDPDTFINLLKQKEISLLMDVRSNPYSKNPNYRMKNLKVLLSNAGIAYHWAGRTLGGFAAINEKNIELLAEFQEGKTLCLMCMEADPAKCHRELEIGSRIKKYGVKVIHIKNNDMES